MRGMALPRRKPNRLPNYDYSQAGYYFITLCTKDKQPLFWQPSVGADIIRPPCRAACWTVDCLVWVPSVGADIIRPQLCRVP